MSDFVTVVNANGEKQRIPRRWLDHPVLGRGFRMPPSAKPKATTTRKPSGKPRGANPRTPISGDEKKEAPDA